MKTTLVEGMEEFDEITPAEESMLRFQLSVITSAIMQGKSSSAATQELLTDIDKMLKTRADIPEITPEMIEAGVNALSENYFDLVDSFRYHEIAKTVFEAMAAKCKRFRHEAGQTSE